jgi:arylsulfatase A-like enzyme
VILIVVDTLRPDHLGSYGYSRATSPGLDTWAQSGVVFDNAYSSSSWTLPAFGTMYTGQYPARHGAGAYVGNGEAEEAGSARGRQRFAGLDTAFPTVAESFTAAGYRTGAVLSNPFLHATFGVARGFDDYDFAPNRRAATTVDRAMSWIAARGEEPFFLMIHFMDTHLPYDPVSEYRGRFTAADGSAVRYPVAKVHEIRRQMGEFGTADRDFIVAAYDEEVAYLDSQLDRLFDELEAAGLWERASVVLTSDHGEEFFEHGGFEHGHAMYDEVVRVPLIIWSGASGRAAEPASLIDLAPTLLDLGGLGVGPDLAGKSLVPFLRAGGGRERPERGLVTEGVLGSGDLRSVILWPNKVIFIGDEPAFLFDLEADPEERDNLLGTVPGLDALVSAAARLLESPTGALEEAVLDPEVLEQLRDIGYIQ